MGLYTIVSDLCSDLTLSSVTYAESAKQTASHATDRVHIIYLSNKRMFPNLYRVDCAFGDNQFDYLAQFDLCI